MLSGKYYQDPSALSHYDFTNLKEQTLSKEAKWFNSVVTMSQIAPGSVAKGP